MSDHRKFSELRAAMPAEHQQRATARTAAMVEEMPLQALRRARELSQEQLGERMHGRQADVSKIERRVDMYLSTLRRYVEAMGGELELVAQFPEGAVRITKLGEIAGETDTEVVVAGSQSDSEGVA